jgi:RimJ/RimL family protein N-acetyltransferase
MTTRPPEDYTVTLALKDGRHVTLRPIALHDAAGLQEGYARLSAESIYMRFFTTATELSEDQAQEFATVDYHDRMAFVGEALEDGQPRIVAVARYSVVPGATPRTAEAGIVVRDDYQSNGLGKLSMTHLVRYAQQQGIKIFYGTIHTTNNRILKFISTSGLPSDRTMLEPGVWEYHIYLDPQAAAS